MKWLNNVTKNKKCWIVLSVTIFVAVFLRFYQLGSVPAGLLNDEANTGYDAFSILLTGNDQWGNFLPITNFIGFGDFPPPVYRYFSIIPIYFFSLTSFSVRFVSALSGVLSVIAIYFLAKKLFNEKVGIFSALFLAIMPWAIGLSRVGIESNLASLFIIISIYFGTNSTTRSLIISAFFAAIAMFTYSAYILFAPLIFALVLFIKWKKKHNFSQLVLVFIFFSLIITPLFVYKNSANTRFSQVGLISNVSSIGVVNKLNDERGQCLSSFPSRVCKIINNKLLVFSNTFLNNYLSHFSPNFIYLNGSTTQYSILPERGLDFAFNFIFLLLGIVYLLKNYRNKNSAFVLIAFFMSFIPDSLTGNGNFSRASIAIPFLALINGLGLYYILSRDFFKKIFIKKGFIFGFLLIVGFSLSSFYVVYLTYFKNFYSVNSQFGYEDLMKKVNIVKNDYGRIYISRHLNDTKQYVYYLFYNQYSPKEYQAKNNVSYNLDSGGWYSIDRIGNLYFVQSIPAYKDNPKLFSENVLFVSAPIDFPKAIKYQFVVKDKLGNVIFKAVEAKDLLEYILQQQKLNHDELY